MKEVSDLQKNCKSWQLNQKERLDDISSLLDTIMHKASAQLWDPERLAQISTMVWRLYENGNKIRKEQEIIRSLNYKARKFRYDAIQDAHIRTFQWVFGSPHDQLLHWLRSGTGIFWVSGKPGSGKSTLMKFIVDESRTRQALAIWAGRRTCITASHFFWISGTTVQMSQEGLFRSLLYEILRARPQMVEALCPSLWKEAANINVSEKDFDQIWSRRSLRDTISRLKAYRDDDTVFCFFIDGLDEYKGDHLDMVRTLEELARSGSIKVCVSSRSWNVFADAFGKDHTRKISVQDLTHEDHVAFVQDRLREHHLWTELTAMARQQILGEILEKAEGVFLWTHLIVTKLREGLSNGDTFGVLQQRVRSFPPDIEDLFSRMMDSIDPHYLPHTARVFQVALHAFKPLPTLLYTFLDDEAEDERYSLHLARRSLSGEELERRIEKVPQRLEARCKGLLEVVISKIPLYGEECLRPRVEFVHRSAKDFLQNRQMTDFLNETAKGFEPHSSILRAYLAGIKVVKANPKPETLGASEGLQDMILDALSYAYSADSIEFSVLDELASTLDDMRKEGGDMPWLDTLVTGVPGVPQEMSHDPGPNPNPFHVLALRCGLTKYFADSKGPQYTACGASLLLVCIVHLHFHHPEYGIDIYDSTMAVMNKGADLNQTLTGYSTVWAFVLCALCVAIPRQSQAEETQSELESLSWTSRILPGHLSTITMLLERGADPNVQSCDGYPIWLDVLNPLGNTTRYLDDEVTRFQIMKAFVDAGASVKSSAALQVWDSLLDLALKPSQKQLTNKQITDLLVLAIDAGVELKPARIMDLKWSFPPILFLRVNEAWSRRHGGTHLAEFSQTSRQKSADLKGLILKCMMWMSVLFLLFYITILFWLYEFINRVYRKVVEGIWNLERSISDWIILHLLHMAVRLNSNSSRGRK